MHHFHWQSTEEECHYYILEAFILVFKQQICSHHNWHKYIVLLLICSFIIDRQMVLINILIGAFFHEESIIYAINNAPVKVSPLGVPPRLTQGILMEKQFVGQNPHPAMSSHYQNSLPKDYISTICNVRIMSEWYQKELLLSESPVWSDIPVS